jgi:hypothetical protein
MDDMDDMNTNDMVAGMDPDELLGWKQQTFDKVWAGFEAQGWALSWNDQDRVCMYRAPGGQKCAVGQLLSDDEYAPSLEGLEVRSEKFRAIWWDLEKEQWTFLGDLQGEHDRTAEECYRRGEFGNPAQGPALLQRRMRNFARQHLLQVPGEGA